MNRTSLFKALAFAVLAIFAGAAFAYPDTASSMWQALTPHADVGAVLAFGPLVRALQSQHAAEVTAMSAFSAIVAERDLTPDEQATFNGHKAKAESLKARIATHVTSAHTCSHGELTDEFREELSTFSIESPFFVLDCRPFGMATHADRLPYFGEGVPL